MARVDGLGFVVTPLARSAALERALDIAPHGSVWIKNETHDMSGSHKARHLMGIMLYLRVVERAAGDPLRVFVPTQASAAGVRQIAGLGACVEVCARERGVQGDPSYQRFREVVVNAFTASRSQLSSPTRPSSYRSGGAANVSRPLRIRNAFACMSLRIGAA